jgi:hypothetical protein
VDFLKVDFFKSGIYMSISKTNLSTDFFVIITVPHAVCPTSKNPKKHECDFRALDVANLLVKILRKKKINFKLIKSQVVRSVVDLNRAKPDLKLYNDFSINEWNKFQNAIHRTIIENQKKKILLLDIHSFDNINAFCKKGTDNCYITILDIYNKPRIKLRRFAETVGLPFTVNIAPGGTNYIINTYGNINVNIPLSTKIYPILLEFFEDYTSLTNETINMFFDKLLEYPFF